MILKFAKSAEKNYRKLSLNIQKKADKQFELLLTNYRHPSLRSRKMGKGDVFEARIDRHYRFTLQVLEGEMYILTIGPHDEGLGKK
ncbi:TPA: hypothetical protein DD690_02035 [Candidatus Daviesbacteria bacterium]|nr:MAG: hypothetical protein A3H81_02145 [Candidatus Daviesbacteria bacterium RIFCSPLOWO2_02_FULL_38_18]OGE72717.1 MAG: hypothetical protein A3H18_05160 [Candidatus Daviesbacteria bacterium RIFCSPLOWO2_12_FULL_38_10]HBQ50742.1 hypothetical protein [Candidatus Daviesbacteria bacterium]